MKDASMLKLKSILKLALQQYFEQSGINQILLQLYHSSKQKSKQPVVKKTAQVQNILKKNVNIMNKKKSQSPSKISALKKSGMSELMMSYDDDEQSQSTPMLNAIKQSTMYEDIPQGSVQSRVVMNENIDPITTGMSVLDSNLPNFLKKGLMKLANK